VSRVVTAPAMRDRASRRNAGQSILYRLIEWRSRVSSAAVM
jgi:hypothetical protein